MRMPACHEPSAPDGGQLCGDVPHSVRRARTWLAPPVLALFAAACAQLPHDTERAPAMHAAQQRWQAELDAFARADAAHPPVEGGVLFVGSSTIRLWSTLERDFPAMPDIVNRGFGGSTMHDCSLLVDRLVLRYRPRQVVIYAGDNDLAQGATPQQVRQDLERFVTTVRSALPAARIAYISIKPSPAREALTPKMREANAVIAAYLKDLPGSDFIDVFTPMLDAHGEARADLFLPDRLHLNAAGYQLWQSVVGPYLPSP